MDRLADFEFVETLHTDALTKKAVFLGRIDGQPALVTLARTPVPAAPPLPLEAAELLDRNDIYSWGVATLRQSLQVPGAKVDVVWPATEKHIAKARAAPQRVVTETPAQYRDVVAPYIATMRGDRIKWVRGILHEGVEADRVLFRDDDPATGFVLLPNSHWDRVSVDTLYLLVLVTRDDLASVRDLTAADLPLLENIRAHVGRVVAERWGLAPDQTKLYFHYQPSYYHLHVHVANAQLQQMDFGRSILLDTVVDMLRARPDGLKGATLSYLLSENHDLFAGLTKRA